MGALLEDVKVGCLELRGTSYSSIYLEIEQNIVCIVWLEHALSVGFGVGWVQEVDATAGHRGIACLGKDTVFSGEFGSIIWILCFIFLFVCVL